MRHSKSALLAVSTLAMAVAVSGCSMGKAQRSFARGADNGNIGVATRSLAALQAGDTASAITFAEKAVEVNPNDAGMRALLGNAYLAGGRFRSAEAAYNDALSLSPNLPGVPLKLALAQAGQGKGDASVTTLETYSNGIDAADAGLAMALAGRPGTAVETLDIAARQPGADARVRQNLALAYALAGEWVKARSIAAQDLTGDQVEQRMSEWAQLAQPGQAGAALAALIGVSPAAADPGQPVRLALNAAASPVRMAAVEAPQEVMAPVEQPAPAAVAVAEPALSAPAMDAKPVEMAAASPVPTAVSSPDIDELVDSLRAEPVKPSGALPKVAELRRSAAKRFGQSKAVLQLGAYATEAGVRMGWNKAARKHAALRSYIPASARFASGRGTVYRLSLKGFESDAEARRLCMQLKASGSSCFVRNAAGDMPVQFASR
jgi:D-alanyl-D-alanine carboxypeptidase